MITKVAVIVCFLMAFVAGLLVGRQTWQSASALPTTRPSGRHGWLVQELTLDAKQQEELERIWSEAARRGRGRELDEQRRALRRERDEAIAALVRPEDYGKYDQILKHYFDRTDAIDEEMKASFDAAVGQTKLILTPAQRAKYEELLKRHQPPDRDGRGPKDRGGREPSSRRGDASATSRPTTAPTGVAPL